MGANLINHIEVVEVEILLTIWSFMYVKFIPLFRPIDLARLLSVCVCVRGVSLFATTSILPMVWDP
jgi:hypothetical protein